MFEVECSILIVGLLSFYLSCTFLFRKGPSIFDEIGGAGGLGGGSPKKKSTLKGEPSKK